MTYYDDLGIPKDSTPEQIHKAYREKAMKTHPDNGGDAQQFNIIATAYKTLIDTESREYYDRTGQQKPPKSAEPKAVTILRNMITEAFGEDQIANPINHIKKKINNAIREHKDNITRIKAKKDKITKKCKKLQTSNKTKSDILSTIIEHLEFGLEQMNLAVESEQEGINTGKEILELIKDIQYEEEFQYPGYSRGTTTYSGLWTPTT